MANLFDRIETAIEMRGMNKNSTSVAAGLAQGHLHNILTRRKSMSALTLLDIAKALDVTTDWLLTGEGPIERWKPDARPVAKPASSPPPAMSVQEAAAKLKAAGIAAFPAQARKRTVRRR